MVPGGRKLDPQLKFFSTVDRGRRTAGTQHLKGCRYLLSLVWNLYAIHLPKCIAAPGEEKVKSGEEEGKEEGEKNWIFPQLINVARVYGRRKQMAGVPRHERCPLWNNKRGLLMVGRVIINEQLWAFESVLTKHLTPAPKRISFHIMNCTGL